MNSVILKETNSQLRTILNKDNEVLKILKDLISGDTNVLLNRLNNENLKTLNSSTLYKKIKACIKVENKAVVICNCGSSDLSNEISKYLLENNFEKIIAGMCIAAKILNTDEGILYIPKESFNELMLNKLETYQDNCKIKLVLGDETLVTRNETALFKAIDGKTIMPYYDDSEIKQYKEKAALVFDGEMACYLFEVSNEKICGKLLSISRTTQKPGIVEVKSGTTLATLVEELEIDSTKIKAILIGGILGKFIPYTDLNKYLVDYEFLNSSVKFYDNTVCMVDETLKIITKSYKESCGKCVLCREGTTQFKAIINDITNGKSKPDDLNLIKETSELIKMGAFCQFGRNMVDAITSSIDLFNKEYTEHIKKKYCAASVCTSLLNYYISPKECTGCGECKDECPEEAIVGKKGFIHMIDEDLCTKCDKCKQVCPDGAVMIMSAVKPKLPKKLTKVGKFI